MILVFAAIGAAGVLLSLLVQRFLSRHLHRILTEVSASPARSGFYTAVSALGILLSGTLAATSTAGYQTDVGSVDLFGGAMTQVRFVLGSLLGIVFVVALGVIAGIRSHELARARDASWGPPPPVPPS